MKKIILSVLVLLLSCVFLMGCTAEAASRNDKILSEAPFYERETLQLPLAEDANTYNRKFLAFLRGTGYNIAVSKTDGRGCQIAVSAAVGR